MLRTLLLAATALSLAPASAQTLDPANPFAHPSTLPYQAPPFDRIKDADYQPALEAGMVAELADMQAIANDPAAPTFDNTIVAMERAGGLLARVDHVFGAVAQANTNPTLQKVRADMAPKGAAHEDAIWLNPKLFARVKALHAQRDTLKLDTEQRMLLEVDYQRFVRAGALLSDGDKATLRDLNKQLSTLSNTFQQKLLAATKAGALVVADPAELAGLNQTDVAAATQAAKDRGMAGKYVVPLQNTTQQPRLQDLSDRATRQALFEKSWTRTERADANDTRDTAAQLALLRARKAKLLGFPSWGDYVLTNQMAKTPQAAKTFMGQLGPATAAAERREAADIQAVIDADAAKSGAGFKLQPWDWERYAERVRKARYDLDEEQLKPYFEIHKVLTDGVFYAANQLYGLSFKPRTDLPTYDPDMMVFEVFEESGRPLGLMYFDYWKRDNKAGGAWMSNFVDQSSLLGTRPVVYNVANFTKPAPGQPALVTSDDVRTMFHEFGHALHGLFAAQTYPTLSGTAVARDFVEFPSQFNEHWALDPKVLAHYAVHYRTGAPIPQLLVDKIKKAETFNQGYATGEALAAAQLDMAWHSLPATTPKQDVDAFEKQALAATGLETALVPPRYRSSYFQHIFAGGYSAGYYAYLWTDMLEEDVYSWFKAHGGLTRANGQRLRDMILSRGHTMDYGPMFRAFYGKDPEIGPMLESRGLVAPR